MRAARGRMLVRLPGMGAVATAFVAGVELVTHPGVEYDDGNLQRPSLTSDEYVELPEETK